MARQSYPTDLTDTEWSSIEGYFFISYDKGGRPLKYEKREILNAIFYILRTGCQWRYLPHDFPPWTVVYKQYQRWKKKEVFEKMNHGITKDIRIKIGRNPNPTAAIVDSQSVKTTEKGALKVTMGQRKSRAGKGIITDTQGFILGCYVGAANENDREGIKSTLNNMHKKYTTVTKMWADMGYLSNELKAYIRENYDIDFEIVKRPPCRFWVPKDTPPELLLQEKVFLILGFVNKL